VDSPNGLVEYSDPHTCYDGFLTIYRLYVDADYNVRSFSLLELPSKQVSKMNIPGIPTPKKSEYNIYRIDGMYAEKGGYRIVIDDKNLKVRISIGDIHKTERPINIIESKGETVFLEYYEYGQKISDNDKRWYQILVDSIEDLPPTKLGLFVESLRFVYENNKTKPDDFTINQFKTILSAHKTHFSLISDETAPFKKIRNLTNKYGDDKREIVDKLLNYIEETPDITLETLVQKTKEKLVYLIYLLLIMEYEDMVTKRREIE
jgi:hypothetical protein